MKVCKKCNIEKTYNEFSRDNHMKDNYKNICKSCVNSNQPNVKIRKGIIKWYKKIKAINYLGSKCNICGDTDIKHLTFHHINSDEKEITLCELFKGSTWERILTEINKCELLCHNCHNEYHYIQNLNNNTNKKYLLEYKDIKCNKCGYDKCSGSLHFHHINKEDKLFKLSDLSKYSNYKSVYDIQQYVIDELNKCEVLCANCHMELDIDNSAIEYVLNNYDDIVIHKTKKIDREIIYDMYFNQNLTQAEIRKKLNLPKSTIFGVVNELRNKLM